MNILPNIYNKLNPQHTCDSPGHDEYLFVHVSMSLPSGACVRQPHTREPQL